jgi:acyl-CoA hydrolase
MLGNWDLTLAALDGLTGTEAMELRAEILFDRFFFRMEDIESVTNATAALDRGSVQFSYLTARLAYPRLLVQREPLPDDAATAKAGIGSAH